MGVTNAAMTTEHGAATELARKPRVVFVDDEKRVLNAMRALFRRDYELYLTTSGEEAVRFCVEHDADVIVADQRMPEMEGVEVLGAVREQAPRTMRILLTGYADLDAIEGSINVGEVFRFLSKPCPPDNLRATIDQAVKASAAPAITTDSPTAPPTAPAADDGDEEAPEAPLATQAQPISRRKSPSLVPAIIAAHTGQHERLEVPDEDSEGEAVVLSGDTIERRMPESFRDMESVGVVVFTLSDEFFQEVEGALHGRYRLHKASRLLQVLEIITAKKAGVLISEVASEGSVLRKVLNKFKQHLPELIAIVVSDDRDAAEMISLINHGQVFRYMAKPVNHDRLMQNVNGGALRHLQMRADPSLIPRMAVEQTAEESEHSGGMEQLFKRIRSLGSIWKRKKD